jgi:WD40 repeat protein
MAFSADGSKFVAASTDRTARVWTLRAPGNKTVGDPVNLEGGHSAAVTSASFSPDGRWVVTSGMEGSIRVWDATTGAEKSALLSRHRGKINQALFDPSGERIISVGDDGMTLVSTCKSCVMPLDDLRQQAMRELSLTADDKKWLERAMN